MEPATQRQIMELRKRAKFSFVQIDPKWILFLIANHGNQFIFRKGKLRNAAPQHGVSIGWSGALLALRLHKTTRIV